MKNYYCYIGVLLVALTGAFCNNNQGDKKADPADSTRVSSDTSSRDMTQLAYVDCYENFFKNLPRLNDSDKVMLTGRNGEPVKFKKFYEDLGSKFARYGLKDLDNDSVPELVIYNYTGGAHCCDELYVFGKEKNGYVFKARLFGGFLCIDAQTDIITYSLNETLGYFFSCYACGFSDSASGFRTIREIELAYKDGKFVIQPYAPATEQQILRNLSILKQHGFEEITQGLMDSGWRKEFAMNFAVWHYNHGKNWDATKKLFDRYYTFDDAAKIWKEFYATLKEAEKESDLSYEL